MIIAIPYAAGEVFQHFGKSKAFKLYDTNEGEITGCKIVSATGDGHAALAEMLKQQKASVLICGGIGGCAKNTLKEYGIQIFGGVTGQADTAAAAYLAGTLTYNPNLECNHHHEHGHTHSDHNDLI